MLGEHMLGLEKGQTRSLREWASLLNIKESEVIGHVIYNVKNGPLRIVTQEEYRRLNAQT